MIKVVTLSDSHRREPAHLVLRRIADDIEQGRFGTVEQGVLVLGCDDLLALFSFGPQSTDAGAVLNLQAAAARIVDNYRKDKEG